jgi:hypothetical protein
VIVSLLQVAQVKEKRNLKSLHLCLEKSSRACNVFVISSMTTHTEKYLPHFFERLASFASSCSKGRKRGSSKECVSILVKKSEMTKRRRDLRVET